MKIIKILILLLIVSGGLKAQYHIRVECDQKQGNEQYYNISYTTNNWIGERQLQEVSPDNYRGCLLYEGDERICKDVILFQFYSNDKARLIEIARNFKSYKDIVAYNKKITQSYNTQHAYWVNYKNSLSKVPPIKKPTLKIKQECCKPIQIY